MALSQANRLVEVTTPALGKDVLLFQRMQAREGLSELFEYRVEMVCDSATVKLEDLLGQSMTVAFDLADGGGKRNLNGIVSEFRYLGGDGKLARYEATIRPWLWFMTRWADCRIFQNQTTIQIIQKVLKDRGFTDIKLAITGKPTTWEYCVQYRETDFNFVSRLLENDGFYYFFEHTASKHTLVIADGPSAHKPASGYETIPYYPPDKDAMRDKEYIDRWGDRQSVITGAYALKDYAFEAPKRDLLAKAEKPPKQKPAKPEIYDYPGGYYQANDGSDLTGIRLQEVQARRQVTDGHTNARGVGVGGTFTLKGFPRDDQNAEYLVVGADFVVTSDDYRSAGGEGTIGEAPLYTSEISCIPAKTVYRPARATPKPTINGPQTATVVGPKGEEIWTDKHGRIKVQFPWDREGKSDENSSCWMRVAQIWAGATWGGMAIPRIGHEVMVEFLEGDPDRPIVTGRVYNGDNMPVYALPANKTQSGLKSRSTPKGTSANFNELRFEDKKDAEEVFFHAEKDFNRVVKNNDTLKVGFEKKDKGDQTVDIYNSRTTTLDQGDDTLTVKTGSRIATIKTDETLTVQTGNQTTKVDTGNQTTTISKGNQTTNVTAGSSTLKAGQSVTIEANTSITLKVGGSSIELTQSGINIKAPMVTVEGQSMTTVKGATTQVNGSGMLVLKGGVVSIN
ncbi:type VI secretion system tip protein TssI/VgrG [Inquilinus sp. CAU 1745]|uniref:type VI secretion system Vgr family protein n=1 Tax=Inquilinus sp. CAU 1745 TaxID=3140369 RepID=UPI00325B35E2